MFNIINKISRRILFFIYRKLLRASLQYPAFESLEVAVNSAINFNKAYTKIEELNTLSVDLGSGINPRNIFSAKECIGLDIKENKINNVISCDLSTGNLPFNDSSVDFITAFDFIEHISRTQLSNSTLNPFINLMNEVYRVLRSGGVFLSHTPAYPFASAFQDPTHINIITEITFPGYFSVDVKGRWHIPWANQYGFNGKFLFVHQYWLSEHLITVLGKE